MKTNGNDPINMAQSPDAEYTGHLPLTKREHFSSLAMQGLLAWNGYTKDSSLIALESTVLADALIEALNKEAAQ